MNLKCCLCSVKKKNRHQFESTSAIITLKLKRYLPCNKIIIKVIRENNKTCFCENIHLNFFHCYTIEHPNNPKPTLFTQKAREFNQSGNFQQQFPPLLILERTEFQFCHTKTTKKTTFKAVKSARHGRTKLILKKLSV